MGKIAILDEESCRNAVPFIKASYPNISEQVTKEEKPGFPQGCFVYTYKNQEFGIYFNTDKKFGKNVQGCRPVCNNGTFGITMKIGNMSF